MSARRCQALFCLFGFVCCCKCDLLDTKENFSYVNVFQGSELSLGGLSTASLVGSAALQGSVPGQAFTYSGPSLTIASQRQLAGTLAGQTLDVAGTAVAVPTGLQLPGTGNNTNNTALDIGVRSRWWQVATPTALLYPPHNEVVGGVYWFHSVRPSLIPCPLCSTYSFGWIHLIFIHLIKQLQKMCRM